MSLLKSLLSTVAVVLASGMAMAFPSYNISYPAPGGTIDDVQMFNSFNVTIDGSYTVADGAEAVLMNLDTGDEYYSTKFMDFAGQLVLINFDSSEIKENGEYEFSIPAGSISCNGESCPKITAKYTLNDPNLGSVGNFPKITFVSSTPANGSDIAAFGASTINRIDFKTSDDAAVNYIGWILYDVTESETEPQLVRQGSENRVDVNRNGHSDDIWVNGLYITIGGEPERLVKGHKYRMDLTFAGIGYDPKTNQYPSPIQIENSTELETSIYFNGLTEPTEYSPYTFVSVSPDPEVYEISDASMARFTITYSGPVKPVEFIYSQGFGGFGEAGTFAPIGGADANGCASQWEFTFHESLIAETVGTIITTIKAQDKDGLYVKGNGGYLLNDFAYTVSWLCNVGAPDITSVSPVQGATVESLSEITVGNSVDLPMAFSYNATENARITDMQGREIRVLNEPVAAGNNQVKWTFEPITENGKYVLIIPAYYFTIGEEMSSNSSKLTTFNYIVENGNTPSGAAYDIEPTSVEPADGSTVESLTSVKLTFANPTFSDAEKGAVAKVYKVNGDGKAIAEATDLGGPNFFQPTEYTFTFPEAITEEGSYYVVIERGQFFDEDYDASLGASGHANETLTYGYVVSNGSTPSGAAYDIVPTSVEPAEGSTVESLTSVKLTFGEMTLCDIEKGAVAKVYKVNGDGNAIAEAISKGNSFFNPTVYNFVFPEAITEEGSYYVEIERGQFFDEDYDASLGASGHANETLTYGYVVSNGSTPSGAAYDIEPTSVEPADGSTVESLTSVKLTFANPTFSDAEKGAVAKVYKVNGDGNAIAEASDLGGPDFFQPTEYTFTFPEAITEEGSYYVVIERGQFFDEDYDASLGASGHANETLTYGYVVSNGSTPSGAVYDIVPTSVEPADGSTVESLTSVKLTFANPTFSDAEKGAVAKVYKVNGDGNAIAEASDLGGPDFFQPTEYTFTFPEAITEEGSYYVKIERGQFFDEEYDASLGAAGHASDEIIYTFEISGTDAIAAIFAAEGEVNVYSANGMVVRLNATIDDFKMLPAGIYLVNGRKVYKK